MNKIFFILSGALLICVSLLYLIHYVALDGTGGAIGNVQEEGFFTFLGVLGLGSLSVGVFNE
jgi:hypothetical protein